MRNPVNNVLYFNMTIYSLRYGINITFFFSVPSNGK